MIEIIIMKGMKQMDEKEHNEREALVYALEQINLTLKKILNELRWLVNEDDR